MSKTRLEGWSSADTVLVLGVLAIGLLASLILGDDYGISWDEGTIQNVGESALHSYSTLKRTLPGLPKLAYYGPFYAAVVSWGTTTLSTILPRWEVYDLRHLLYSLCLPVTAASVFAIARGMVGRAAALFGSLLLLTQPFLVGHAFINPKDIPFMGFFAASVAFGFLGARSLPRRKIAVETPTTPSAPSLEFTLWHRWRATPAWFRVVGMFLLAVTMVVLLDVLIFHRIVLPGTLAIVSKMYRGDAPTLLQQVFDREAELRGSLPVEAYYQKATNLHARLARLLARTLVLLGMAVWIARHPPRWNDVGSRALGLLVASAILVGLTTSIRVVGPLAGVLVGGLLLLRMRWQAIVWLLMYWLLATGVAYATWPLLWTDPGGGLLKSIQLMASFPWNDPVVYRGVFIRATELPPDYPLTHAALQLTLPALLLGMGGGIWGMLKYRRSPLLAEVTLLWLWLACPYALAIAGNMTLYDGARQLLFAMPPLFVLAALGLRGIFERIEPRFLRVVLVALALLPGLVAIARLHPYEYVYYNEIVGGVAGASRRFELDYWGVGMREAMGHLNEIADQGATYTVLGPRNSAEPFARADLVRWTGAQEGQIGPRPDYIVATTRWNWDLGPENWDHYAKATWWPEAEVVWILERQGAPLVVIKEHSSGS